MKKNTVKLFILALALGSGIIATAQDSKKKERAFRTDERVIKELSLKYSAKFAAQKAEAVKLAKENNWPLEIKKEDGTFSQLVAVDGEGNPLYLTSYNVGSAVTSKVTPLQPGGSTGLDLTGKFDDGTIMEIGMWDGQYPRLDHQEYTGRISGIDGAPTSPADHPSHVLGTMLAAGVDPMAKGMANEAKGKVANFANDFDEMLTADVILSNHSYGLGEVSSSLVGKYLNDYTRPVDDITFNLPYYQPVFAAGNDGDGVNYDRLTDRSIAKNGITVAAIYELDYITTTVPQIAEFSSFGPPDDNRIKPDISAKGVDVYSTLSGSSTSYGILQGTSMACPGVTGALALIQQYYAELHTPAGMPAELASKTFMLSSTLRALVAHCATEAGSNPGPDPKFGWGVLNAEKMADVITKEGEESLLLENILTPGQVYEIEVEAIAGQPLVATLAWTDPAPADGGPNSVINNPVVNNLDIRVIKGTTTNFPWKLGANDSSPAVKGDNNIDNIEKVEIANASGTYTIRVSHKGTTLLNPIPVFPGEPEPPAQQVYSLVVTGINATLGNEDFTKEGFSVWPNPAKGLLNISMVSAIENSAVATIYDMQGRIVLTSKITDMDTELNIENLTSGMYIVNIANGNKNEVKKFIVK